MTDKLAVSDASIQRAQEVEAAMAACPTNQKFRLQDVAARAGVTVETLRKWLASDPWVQAVWTDLLRGRVRAVLPSVIDAMADKAELGDEGAAAAAKVLLMMLREFQPASAADALRAAAGAVASLADLVAESYKASRERREARKPDPPPIRDAELVRSAPAASTPAPAVSADDAQAAADAQVDADGLDDGPEPDGYREPDGEYRGRGSRG